MPKPLISDVRRAGDLLYLSGVVGDGDDTLSQARSALADIKQILEENGSRMENVVAATVYLTDINERPTKFNPAWREVFPDNPPTRTCIQIVLAPPHTVEITVVATLNE